jgi:aromatic ring-opening dioxygenase LigB subunit
MNADGFFCSVLMCHAPIVIPEFSAQRAELCRRSTEAMRDAAEFLAGRNPDVVVVLSPHTPRFRDSFALAEGERLVGHFGSFGRSEICAHFASDGALQRRLVELAKVHEIDVVAAPQQTLDHGALVPLFFLQQAGFKGRVLVVGFPYNTSAEKNRRMGELLAQLAAEQNGGRWALLASGDMSHRLTPGAPAGYHPHAERFDRVIVKCVECGRYKEVSSIDGELRELAAEDVVDSIEIAAAALRDNCAGKRVLSYEGPFGVGYLVAILCDGTGEADDKH